MSDEKTPGSLAAWAKAISESTDPIKEANDWLAQDDASQWGEHEWRLFNVVERAVQLQARIEELEQQVTDYALRAMDQQKQIEILEREKLKEKTLRVKPLTWDGYKADTHFGRYDICPYKTWGTEEWMTRVFFNGEPIGDTIYEYDIAAGQAIAQADYNRHILSALIEGDKNDDERVREEALREALVRIANLDRGSNEDVDKGHEEAYRSIEALIEGDTDE